jgi:hypothetical protein
VCLSPEGTTGTSELAPVCDYIVTIFTSDIRGAGTDANVYIELQGEKDGKVMDLGKHRLENSANNFERGKQVGAAALVPSCYKDAVLALCALSSNLEQDKH